MAPAESIRLSIAKARTRRNWSQQQLATAIGVERTTIWRYEAGRQDVEVHHLVAMARVLGAPDLLAKACSVCPVAAAAEHVLEVPR